MLLCELPHGGMLCDSDQAQGLVPLRHVAGAVRAKVLVAVPRAPVPEQADVCRHVRGQDPIQSDVPVAAFQGRLHSILPNLVQEGVVLRRVTQAVHPQVLNLRENPHHVPLHHLLAVLARVHDDGADPQRRLAVEHPIRPARDDEKHPLGLTHLLADVARVPGELAGPAALPLVWVRVWQTIGGRDALRPLHPHPLLLGSGRSGLDLGNGLRALLAVGVLARGFGLGRLQDPEHLHLYGVPQRHRVTVAGGIDGEVGLTCLPYESCSLVDLLERVIRRRAPAILPLTSPEPQERLVAARYPVEHDRRLELREGRLALDPLRLSDGAHDLVVHAPVLLGARDAAAEGVQHGRLAC